MTMPTTYPALMRRETVDGVSRAYIEFNLTNDPARACRLMLQGSGGDSNTFGLYGPGFPTGAHIQLTEGGSIGIWTSRQQRLTLVGDSGVHYGTWDKTAMVNRDLQAVGPHTVPAQNVAALSAALDLLLALAARAGLDTSALEAAIGESVEMVMPEELGHGEG